MSALVLVLEKNRDVKVGDLAFQLTDSVETEEELFEEGTVVDLEFEKMDVVQQENVTAFMFDNISLISNETGDDLCVELDGDQLHKVLSLHELKIKSPNDINILSLNYITSQGIVHTIEHDYVHIA